MFHFKEEFEEMKEFLLYSSQLPGLWTIRMQKTDNMMPWFWNKRLDVNV